MFSNYVKTMKNSGLRATPALVTCRPTGPIKNKKLNLASTSCGVRKSYLRFRFLVLVSLDIHQTTRGLRRYERQSASKTCALHMVHIFWVAGNARVGILSEYALNFRSQRGNPIWFVNESVEVASVKSFQGLMFTEPTAQDDLNIRFNVFQR